MSSPGSSIRTSTFICRSWARSAKDNSRDGEQSRAGRRHHHASSRWFVPARNDEAAGGFRTLAGARPQGKSACDFTFHMGVTRFDDEAEDDFARSWRGMQLFKIFLAYKGAFGIDDDRALSTL